MEYITSQIAFKGQNADPALALIEGTITLDPTINKPGHGGNTISIDVAQASTGVIEYTSRSYPTNTNFIERPGVVVEYNINFGNSLNFGLVLPNGYMQCDFLESTGTQWIDTGVKLSNESEVNISYSLKQRGNNQYIFGASTAWNKNNFSILAESLLHPDRVYAHCLATNTGSMTWTNAQHYEQRREMYVSSAYGSLDGVVVTNPAASEIFETEKSAKLFTLGGEASFVKVFALSISRSGTSQLNYVPTLDAQGVPCMWDTVSKTAKYNAGTGSFVAGMTSEQALNLANLPGTEDGTLTVSLPESLMDATYNVVDPATISALDVAADNGWTITIQSWVDEPVLPEGYIRGNFLESTGTQYLPKIEYPATQNIDATIDCQFTQAEKRALIGADLSACYWGVKGGRWEKAFVFSDSPPVFGRYTHLLEVANGEGYLQIGTWKVTAILTPEGSTAFSFRIGYAPIYRMFSFALKTEGVLRSNYVPALDDTGKPCMYDKVTGAPKYNAGTGAFIFGLTSEQALNLANLPATTDGNLTVSLPEVVVSNGDVFVPSIRKAFDTAATNGWTFTIQTYGDGLPEGSIPLDFLESTGEQYIDTGVTANENTSAICDAVNLYDEASSFEVLFGARRSYLNNTFTCFSHLNTDPPTRSLRRGSEDIGNIKEGQSGRAVYAITPEYCRVGDFYKNWNNQDTFETPTALTLCALRSPTNPAYYFARARVYSFAIANQTAPQANYVPIITAEGVPAMWDYVSKTAKLNAGTGSFIAGLTSEQATKLANLPAGGGELTISLPQGDVTDAGEVYTEAIKTAADTAAANGWTLTIQTYGDELPGGCVPAEFLESTGTQWIDTGIKLSNESEMAVTFVNTYPTVTHQYRTLAGSDQFFVHSGYVNTLDQLLLQSSIRFGSETVYPYWNPNTQIKVIVNTSGYSINGKLIKWGNETGNFESTHNCLVFRTYTTNFVTTNAKVYDFSISRSGTKQANYTPIITAAGVPAMWDSVTRTAKYNADTTEGAADFVVGLTAENALKLANLPVTTGETLTISLPPDVVDENGVLQDMAIFAALSAAAAKGWSFIIQTHDGTAVETAVPAGYMECEFLESTGEQYIDTGLLMSSADDLKTTFAFLSKTENFAYIYDTGTNWLENKVSGYIQKGASGENTLYALFGTVYAQSTNADLTRTYMVEAKDGYSVLNGVSTTKPSDEFESSRPLHLFSSSSKSSFAVGRIFDFLVSNSGTERLNLTPVIDSAGVPCMWDSVSSTAKTNARSGAFIVGMTAAQAVQLANLPTGGGELTVSLPQSILNTEGEITDAAVRAALNKAAENGWTITLQYYTEGE